MSSLVLLALKQLKACKNCNACFVILYFEVTDEDESLIPSVRDQIMNHLEILSQSFGVYIGVGYLEASEE